MRSSILALLILVSTSCSLFAVDKNTVAEAVKKDGMTVQDCRKWYTVYKGAYIYVKELECTGSDDFGDVFDRFRKVRDKVMPAKGNTNFVAATDLSKYAKTENVSGVERTEYVPFTAENKTDLAEDLFQICEGLKAGIK